MKDIFGEVHINELLFCLTEEEMIPHLLPDGIALILLFLMLSLDGAFTIKILLLIKLYFLLKLLEVDLFSKWFDAKV